MNYNSKTSLACDLPKNGETSPKQSVNIAGYPVGVSISSPTIKNDSVFEQTLKQTALESLPAYFEFNIDKNIKHLNLDFDHPDVEEKVPWNFDIKLK